MTLIKREIVDNIKAFLELTELGLKDLLSDNPKHKDLGLRNLAMHGRSLTIEMFELGNTDSELNEWLIGIQNEMKSSKVCRYFEDLSMEIYNQEKLIVRSNDNSSFTVDMFNRLPQPQIAKAIGFFISDSLGGYGWDIALPNGKKDKFYLELPQEILNIEVTETTSDYLEALGDKTVEKIGQMYFTYLSGLVDRIANHFS
jgi:hypothetical protein